MPASPVTIAVTGAGGHIGYALLFRIAAGEMLGANVPVRLRLLETAHSMSAVEGTALELADGAFPLLADIEITDQVDSVFEAANIAILAGARPRAAGMTRRDLLEVNGSIFAPQGAAIEAHAADNVRVLVIGNPANTNTLITMAHARGVPSERFTAMSRLDHNRARSRVAQHVGVPVSDVTRIAVWGNHSATQYPDLSHVRVAGKPIVLDREWVEKDFIPAVANRGAEIIRVRGASSAASAANAAIDHVRDWVTGTPQNDFTSASLMSDGSYGVPVGLVSSFPVISEGGRWRIVEGLPLDDLARTRIETSAREIADERDAVAALGLV